MVLRASAAVGSREAGCGSHRPHASGIGRVAPAWLANQG